MPIPYIAIFLQLCCGLTVACPILYQLDSSSCIFYTNYLDTTCFNFTLSHCTYVYYERVRIEYNWGECTAHCCDSSVTYLQDNASIQQCQEYIYWRKKLTYIILSCSLTVAIAIPTFFLLRRFGHQLGISNLNAWCNWCNEFVLRWTSPGSSECLNSTLGESSKTIGSNGYSRGQSREND